MMLLKILALGVLVIGLTQYVAPLGDLHLNLTTRNTEMLRSIADTTEDYAGRHTVILLRREFIASTIADNIINSLTNPMMIIDEEKIPAMRKFVILLPQKNFNYTNLMPSLNHGKMSVYLAVFQHPDFDEETITDLFEEFWSVRIFSVLALWESGENKSIGLYTYKPFSKFHCWNRGQLILLDTWDPVKGSMSKGRKFSFDFKNFYGCDIRCLGITRPPDNIMIRQDDGSWTSDGVGGKVLEIVAKKLNFNPVISVINNNVSEEYGWYFTEGPGELISKALIEEQYDLAYGWFSEAEYGYHGVERTQKTSIDCFGWAVPYRAGPKPDSWSNYVREFSMPVWLMVFISVVGATLTLYFVPALMRAKTDGRFRNVWYSLMYTISTLIEQPHHEKIQASSLRIFISNWLWFGLVITTAYKAMLGSYMAVPLLGPEFMTTEDVIYSKLHVGGGQETLRLLNHIAVRSARTRVLLQRYETLKPQDFGLVTQRIVRDRDFAVFGVKRFIYHYSIPEAKRLRVRIPVRFIPGCLLRPHTTQFMLKKNSYLRNPINRILLRLVESGIIEKWVVHLGRNVVLTVERIKGRSLKLSRCYAPFVLLFIGICISYAVLNAEITMAKKKQKAKENSMLFIKRDLGNHESGLPHPIYPYLP
nr:PREDICTED: uncharacterized protein LOC109042480 [Bemisia tabaci]